MTNEEAVLFLGQYVDNECYTNKCQQAHRIAIEAIRTADHIHDTTKMVPLTLEQLREMDGKPVWVERNESPHDGKWFIVDHADVENPDRTLYTREGVTYSDYGKYFTAYAYQPAHIDREAWEPCEYCNKQDDPCLKGGCFRKNRWKCGFTCDKYREYQKKVETLNNSRFCPECGRPLTPEAWAELEKRLSGQQQKPLSDAPGTNLESSEKGQVRISSLKGPNGLQIYIGFKCGSVAKDISFVFDKQDPSLDDICKFLSQQLTELVQSLNGGKS